MGLFLMGMCAGLLLLVVVLSLWATTPRDVYGEVCTDVFNAEYVPDLRVCLAGDTIVHRFGEGQ